MKITRSENKNVCEFSDIEIGDVFEYEERIYMRIGTIKPEQINAIRVTDGYGVWFFKEKVMKLDAELVIK